MMKKNNVALVCILVMVVMVVVEPTIVQGKVEEKSHLEAAKEATSQSIQNAVDKAGEAGEKIQYHTGQAAEAAKDTVTAAGVKASEATQATKDTLLTTGQKMQESVEKVYDTTTGALGSAGETLSNSLGSAKDTVFGVTQKQQEEPEGGVYDRVGQYYDIATQKTTGALDSAGETFSNSLGSAKDTVFGVAQKQQEEPEGGVYDRVGQYYDIATQKTTGALGSAGETFSNSLGSAKDTVFGVAQKQQEEPEGGVYDRVGQYYDIATQKTAEAAQAMKAAAAQAAQHVQGNAYQAADTSRNTLHDTGSTIYDSLAMAGEKLSQAAEAARDSTLKTGQSAMWGAQNVHNSPGGTYYEGAKDTVGEYYRSMTEKLGSIAVVMGWQPVPDAQMKKRDRSKLSPYSVFIGNKMYELPQKQQQQDGYLNRAFNSMEEAARSVREKTLGSDVPSESSHEDGALHSMRDKLGATADYTTGTITGASESMKDAAQKMGDYTTGTISGASESMKDAAQKMGETWESAAEKVGGATENLKKNVIG